VREHVANGGPRPPLVVIRFCPDAKALFILNGGREWQPKGKPDLVDVHDFPSDAIGKAIPYGVYDIAANDGLSAWASNCALRSGCCAPSTDLFRA
jgi:hypothetical protein